MGDGFRGVDIGLASSAGERMGSRAGRFSSVRGRREGLWFAEIRSANAAESIGVIALV
jgi:hypothetical protein